MDLTRLDASLMVSPQLEARDFEALVEAGVKTVICLRPDDEEGDYLSSSEAEALAEQHGLHWVHAPVRGSEVTDHAVEAIGEALRSVHEPALAYCRSGRRVALAWGLAKIADGAEVDSVLSGAAAAGFDLADARLMLQSAATAAAGDDTDARAARATQSTAATEPTADYRFDVAIIGGGSAGLATAASLLKRRPELSIGVIEPSDEHHYQPGLTLVGTGHFDPAAITRREADLIPEQVTWVRAAARSFDMAHRQIELGDGRRVAWHALVVAPGLTLDWDGIEGAREALGDHGVCCNYSPEHAPYTWQQVRGLRRGRALFTQPAMPIKCAGAPQKALYLSCDRWRKAGTLRDIDVQFHNAGGALFGVAHFVPALMRYVERYGAALHFGSTLIRIDGPARKAVFRIAGDDGAVREEERSFDLLHFVPPQRSPDFIAASPLADDAGWLAVDPDTLQHPRHPEVFGVGDVIGASNAKTMAAARKQAPIVAENLLAHLDGRALPMGYDGYGACPLTVEAGRVVLAEFGYGGKLLPTFPLAPEVPRRSQWVLKRHLMPWIYWELMLKGREWFAAPEPRAGASTAAPSS